MIVYLLVHEENDYDSGEFEVRGVYRHSEDAKASLITRTPAGRPSKAGDAHNNDCCSVMEYDVLDVPDLDIKADPPPLDPNAPQLISTALLEAMIRQASDPNPFTRFMPARGPIARVTDIEETDDGVTFKATFFERGSDAT